MSNDIKIIDNFLNQDEFNSIKDVIFGNNFSWYHSPNIAYKNDSHKIFMDVALAPEHGFRPAAPALEAGPSKASLILGLADTGMKGAMAFGKNTAKDVHGKRTPWYNRERV